jgi:hypothetical protein
MTDVIDRLLAALNAHDLAGAVGLVHQDYQSVQPAHPARAFTGRDLMRANWAAMFAGIPDFCANVRGVTLFQIADDQIVAGRLYLEDVEQDAGGIDEAVEGLSGRRPRPGPASVRE